MRDLWPFIKLYRRHLGLMLLGVLLSFVTLLASLGLLALSGWFITATAIAGLSAATAHSFNFFTPGAGVRGFSITRTAARYFERLVSHDATFKLLAWLRGWFFAKLAPLSLVRLQAFRKGDLLNRLVADVDALDQLYLRLFSPLLSAVLVIAVLTLGLSYFNTTLGMTALVLMSVWVLLLPFLFYRLGNKSGQLLGREESRLRQQSLDYLQGMADSLIFGATAKNREKLDQVEANLNHQQQRMLRLEGFGSALLILASGLAALVMLYVASGELRAEQISGPVMVMAVFGMLAAFEALTPLPGAFQFLGKTRLAAARLREIIELPPQEFPQASSQKSDQAQVVDGKVTFEGVQYSYPGAGLVLEDVNLKINAGQHVALVGKTGCGKSTLLRLLTRQLDSEQGSILLDGHPVSSFPENRLLSAIAVLPQRTHVFSATLRDNLKLAAPNASDETLLSVIAETGLNKLAAADGNILDLWLGQGGIALSGGEQRRLAIARVMLREAPVLIMDEPSEGLDVVSEKELMGKVLQKYKGRTVLLVTHKLSMLKAMDVVYRMETGRIVQVTTAQH